MNLQMSLKPPAPAQAGPPCHDFHSADKESLSAAKFPRTAGRWPVQRGTATSVASSLLPGCGFTSSLGREGTETLFCVQSSEGSM